MSVIEHVTLYRLKVPLTTPYKLAFGPVRAFDTILVEAVDSDGREGLGEATLLTGYTEETIDGSWALARELALRMVGRSPMDAKRVAEAAVGAAPFTTTALATAVDMLEGHPCLSVERTTTVPLLGLVNGTQAHELESEIEKLLSEGHGTLKIKVGFDPERDARKVALVQRFNRGRARLRIDANQGYNVDEARRFLRTLDPAGVELFEQPCAAGDWTAAKAVAEISPVPMMLDESIYGLEDIDRAARLRCASFIKLKLMKMGSLDRLKAGIERIRALGMEPVLGNGVACEIGCWMEACVARETIGNAGEMNGFLKPVSRLLERPLRFERGAIVLEPGDRPSLDRDALARYTVAREGFSAKASAAL
ncbi:MAG: dipeptide epimerase [Burkholderiales bacterium]|nr:MAG: dipeptide epimerase [Burkholderiales bacterium]